MESASGVGCHAPAQAIGDGKYLLQGTSLLNIAGEKMEGSGTLGYPTRTVRCACRFSISFCYIIDEIEQLYLFCFSSEL